MHEASIVESLIKTILQDLPPDESVVTKINLTVGEATGYMASSLEHYLGLFAKDTRLEGAVLDITHVKPLLRCNACGADFARTRFSFQCPECGGEGVMTKKGYEFFIESVEIRNHEIVQ